MPSYVFTIWWWRWFLCCCDYIRRKFTKMMAFYLFQMKMHLICSWNVGFRWQPMIVSKKVWIQLLKNSKRCILERPMSLVSPSLELYYLFLWWRTCSGKSVERISYRDVLAWKYEEMPGFSPQLVTHSLAVSPGVKPVKHYRRTFSLSLSPIQKWLNAGPFCIRNGWRQKNGQIRVCVDFRDLNKAWSTNQNGLQNMDMLIDNGFQLFCLNLWTV